MFKLDLDKEEEPEIKLPTSAGSLKKQRVPEKHLFLLYWLCQSLWPCGGGLVIVSDSCDPMDCSLSDSMGVLSMGLCRSQQTVENSSRDGYIIPSDLPPEKSVCRSRSNRTGYETTDWFQIGKGVRQGCILSPYLFNLYAEYIMWNARVDEAQTGIKIPGRNINNINMQMIPL